MLVSHCDVIVIGAGIVGAACAHELSRAGCAVTVLDDRRGGATQAGMGHLVVMDDDAAEFALARASMQRWQAWREQLPAACAYSPTGTLWLAANDNELAEAQRKHHRLAAGGVHSELLDAVALAAEEPALTHDLAGGLRVPADAIVYAPAVADWLLASAPRPIVQRRATAEAITDDGVRLTDGTLLRAGAVVLAAGIDALALCPELPLQAKKGHLVITDRLPTLIRHELVELGYIASAHARSGSSVAFNAQPRPTGQLLIGSSRQFDSADARIDHAILSRMLRRALRYLPALADVPAIRSWTGLRPATPDGLPIIGRHPTRPRLWLALGHEGLGVTTAPGTAMLMAAAITGQGGLRELDAEPYRADRFAGLRARNGAVEIAA